MLTTDCVSTKHTFDHQSQKSVPHQKFKRAGGAYEENHFDHSEDLDKTANIINL
jgi:hypothetical protein